MTTLTRSKVVELSGKKYQVNKLPADSGSFILWKMMGISMRDSANAESEKKTQRRLPADAGSETERPKIDGETHVRALSFVVFSGGIAFDDYKFIYSSCLKSVFCFNEANMPMPVVSDSGAFTGDGADLESNVGLSSKLVTEVLVFSLADFFNGDSPGS